MRTCKICKEEKPDTEYYKMGKFGLDTRCKPCHNQERKTRGNIRKKAIQDGLIYEGVPCSICGTSTTMVNNTKTTAVADHCHDRMTLRGILCMSCNSALGKFGDNVETLKRALDYLNKTQG